MGVVTGELLCMQCISIVLLQIIDTGEEVLPALLHYAKSVLEHPLLYTDITKAEQPKFDEQAILAHL